jgi:hypothetical protein
MIERAKNINLETYRGNTERLEWYFFNETGGVQTPIALASEFTAVKMAIRKRNGSDSTLIIEKTLTLDGNLAFTTLTAAETQAIDAGVYFYDVKCFDVQGREFTYFDGIVRITDNKTV